MPARRPGGKAASRKARQRYVPRTPAAPKAADAPAPAPEPVVETAPVETPVAPARPRSADASRRRPPPVPVRPTGSGLSARERADYHYVERDLRNIGILTVLMAVLLGLAWVVFNTAGLLG